MAILLIAALTTCKCAEAAVMINYNITVVIVNLKSYKRSRTNIHTELLVSVVLINFNFFQL